MNRRTLIGCVVVFLTALLLYLPALRNGFAYDDVAVVERDTRIHSLANVPSFFATGYWADAELALYRPVTTMSFAVDWAISDGDPAWFHFANALWNALACTLVFLVLSRLTSLPAALAGALIFAAHPVHTEAVANIVGRAEVIAAVFMLAAILVWPRSSHAEPRLRVAGVALLYVLALLTKESAIMLPALLVLVDAARRDLAPGAVAAWWRSRRLAIAALGATATGYLALRHAVLGGLAPSRLDAAIEVTSGVERTMTALQVWPVIARLLLFPRELLADYGPRIIMPAMSPNPAVIAGAIILAGLIGAGIVLWLRRRGTAAMALLWVPVALLPVSNLLIPIGIILAERTLYLPSLAVAFGVAILIDIVRRMPAAARFAGATLIVIAFSLLSARTLTRIPEWRSTDSIFAALLRDRPDSFRAHWHHARLAAVAGEHDTALQKYVHALEIWPHRERLVRETVRAALRAGNIAYALNLARFGYSRWPRSAETAQLYAAATLDAGDTIAARAIIADALRYLPQDSLLLRMQDAVGTNGSR